MFVPFWY